MTYPSVESFCIYSCYIGDLAWTIQPFVCTGKCNLGAFNILSFYCLPSLIHGLLILLILWYHKKSKGHCGCDHTLVGFTMQSVPINTKVVSSNTLFNIM